MRLTSGIVSGICFASVLIAKGSAAQPYQPGPPPPAAGPAPGYPGAAGAAPGAAPGYAPQGPGYPQQPAPQSPPAWGPPPQGPAPQGPQAPQGAPAYGQQPQYGAPPTGAPTAAAGASASTSAGFAFGDRGSYGNAGSPPSTEAETKEEGDTADSLAYRRESLKVENTIDAATGLLRVQSAGSGAVGTFRFSLLSSYFKGSGFLCPPCTAPNGGLPDQPDDATHIGGHVGISATPVSFLEAYLGIHTTASSNSLDKPELLQVLGDTNFGFKAFIPYDEDSIFSAGGGADVLLLNGVGGVGIDNANFGLRGLATADFQRRKNPADRLPLRVHLNLGYLFENSGKLVEDFENRNDGTRISRIRRFGLGINRVDSFRLGLGVEAPFGIVAPFLEWTADVPVNRQNHVCDVLTRAAGDQCLGQDAQFSAVPSRLSLGARVYPWLDGLALLAAFDIGTGATSNFIEEVAPELPWNFYLGIAFAADTKPHVEIRQVEAPRMVRTEPPRQSHFIQGTVVEKGTGAPVPDAIIHFDGRSLTGLVTMADGTFRTGDLEPGTYTFNVSANGYRDGQCNATIPFGSGGQPGMPGQYGAPAQFGAPPSAPQGPYGAAPQGVYPGAPSYGQPEQPGAAPGQPYPQEPFGGPQPAGMPPQGAAPGAPSAIVTCELESLPKVGNVNGQLNDADSGAAVGGAQVKITDKLGRSLSLTADGSGAFRFENVPPGPVSIAAETAGYLRSVIDIEVKAHTDVSAQIHLNKRPARPNVIVTGKEIKLKKGVHFQHDSSEILPDSMEILEEIADVLSSRPDIPSVEIQGHTDDSGTPDYNMKLSGQRANAVREALVRNGVDQARLTARGYGQERPLAPNTNEANRAKNRRVQLMIEK